MTFKIPLLLNLVINFVIKHYIKMKYILLICLSATILGVITQSQNEFNVVNKERIQIRRQEPINRQEIQDFQSQQREIISDANIQAGKPLGHQQGRLHKKNGHHQMKNHKDHQEKFGKQKQFEQNVRPHHPIPSPFDDEESMMESNQQDRQYWMDESQNQEDQERQQGPHHGKRRGKIIKHIIFFAVIGLISFFLIRKCIRRKKQHCRRRVSQMSLQNNPNSIDAEINKHYAQIEKLTRLKEEISRRSQPIIRPYLHEGEIELHNASNGRMVNQNSYPQNAPINIQYPQIPVGRPVHVHQNPYRFNNNRY